MHSMVRTPRSSSLIQMWGLELVVMLPVDYSDHPHCLRLLWLLVLILFLVPPVVLLLWLVGVLWMCGEL
jgi:hypothetical protein